MNDRILEVLSLLVLVLFLICAKEITAQESSEHLIISQVSLNNDQKSKSWIEIYNPTDYELVLERFRLSHLKTINVLPDSINKEGGIKINAGGYVVLCADEDYFKTTYGKEVKVFYVKALSHITSGGFLAITTKGVDITKGGIVRYGKEEWSSKIAEIAGEQVVRFSEEGKSFIRKIEKSEAGIAVSDFTESTANPGKPNN
jgi:hypothetical protein